MKHLLKKKSLWVFLFVILMVLNLVPVGYRKKMTLFQEVNNLHVDGTDVCISILHNEKDSTVWINTFRNGTRIFDQSINYKDDSLTTSMVYFDKEGNYCEVIDVTGDGIPNIKLMDMEGNGFRRLYFVGGEFKDGTCSEGKLLIDGREIEVVDGRYTFTE